MPVDSPMGAMPSHATGRFTGLGLALGVAFAWLVLAALDVWNSLDGATSKTLLGALTAGVPLQGSPLLMQIALFTAALAALYASGGIVAWGLARLACRSFALPARYPRTAAFVFALALFTWAAAANSVAFPWSASSGHWAAVARWSIGSVKLIDAMTALGLSGIWVLVYRSVSSTRFIARHGKRVVAYGILAVVALVTWRVRDMTAIADPSVDAARPNVIVIGIDALRPDIVAQSGPAAVTPGIDEFVDQAVVFRDTITPLARTFPAWVSILTGRNPASIGAFENLVPRESIRTAGTLGDWLRASGYRTVYATDEVRFSNIDASFGFDQVIGPRMGASDFLLGTLNDTPLSNLVANTVLGKWLFPNTYANRAAARTYRPDTFVRELDRSLDFSEPVFFSVHLTTPHWPFHWADDQAGSPAASQRQPYTYVASVMEADRQFQHLMAVLERKGALANAIVVVLSDHGEGLGLDSDNLLQGTGSSQQLGVPVWMWGHGNSVLDPGQFSVLFAWRGYGPASFSQAGRNVDTPATLEDLAPTVLDLIGAPVPQRLDGMSLASVVRGAASPDALTERLRFTETGISIGFTAEGAPKLDDVAKVGPQLYRVNSQTARVELRPEYRDRILRSRERAVIRGDRMLAAIPGAKAGAETFLLVARDGSSATRVDPTKDTKIDPGLQEMWQGLREHYGSELITAR